MDLSSGMPRNIEESGGATRVRLRPSGCANFVAVPFLFVWLCGWFAGEVLVLGIVLRYFGVDVAALLPDALGRRIPDIQVHGAPIFFLLFWLTFWTFGGIAALSQFLRLSGGSDVIELRPDSWSSWRGIFAFGRERIFRIGDAEMIYTRRKDNALVAKVAGKEVLITNFGAASERAWLRDQIASRYGVALPKSVLPSLQTTEGDVVLPPQWSSQALADGTIAVTASPSQRRTLHGCVVIFAAIVEGMVALPAVIHFATGTASTADFVRAFFAVVILAGAVVLWNANETWSVREGLLVRDRVVGPWRKTDRFTGGVFSLSTQRDSDGDERFMIELAPSDAKKFLLYSSSDQAAVIGVARFLASKTGWRIEVPESVIAP